MCLVFLSFFYLQLGRGMKQVRVTNKGHNARENTTLRGSPTRKRLRRKADKIESCPQYAL